MGAASIYTFDANEDGIKWRVMVEGEDGFYCDKDGFSTKEGAGYYAAGRAVDMGEGQRIFVQAYRMV